MAADRVEPGRSDEVAAGQSDHAQEDRTRTIEIISAVLLSLATVLAAWSAFQSAKWSGVQATRFSQASALRMESVRASTAAGGQEQVDVTLFAQWVNAYDAGNTRLADFYFERFRAEFKPAMTRGWPPSRCATRTHRPHRSPCRSTSLRRRSGERTSPAPRDAPPGAQANQNSDDYVLLTVLFASTLLFASLASKFTARAVRLRGGLALGCCPPDRVPAAYPRQF